MAIYGVDVSSHQGPNIDWQALRAAGYEFAFVKVAGGSQYRNPYYAQQIAGARAAGLLLGHYHYDGEPTVATGSPDEEARFFLSQLDLQVGELLALDCEERATRLPSRYARWRDLVKAATGVLPFLYTFPSFITEASGLDWAQLADMPLWYASYYDDGNRDRWPIPPHPWVFPTIWQYNGGVAVPGTTFPTDCNVFAGTRDQLLNYGRLPDLRAESKPLTPPAPPADDPSGAAVRILPDGSVEVRVNFGGVATGIQGVNYADLGVSVVGADGAIYDRSIQGGAFGAWRKRGA